jgi:hypothetical protein
MGSGISPYGSEAVSILSVMGSQGFRLALIVVVVLIFGLALLWTYTTDDNEVPSYPYSQLLADAAAGKVEAITRTGPS